MNVVCKPLAAEPMEFRNDDLLADLSGLLNEFFGNGHSVDRQSIELLDVFDVVIERQLTDLVCELGEAFVFGDKIGLAT